MNRFDFHNIQFRLRVHSIPMPRSSEARVRRRVTRDEAQNPGAGDATGVMFDLLTMSPTAIKRDKGAAGGMGSPNWRSQIAGRIREDGFQAEETSRQSGT